MKTINTKAVKETNRIFFNPHRLLYSYVIICLASWRSPGNLFSLREIILNSGQQRNHQLIAYCPSIVFCQRRHKLARIRGIVARKTSVTTFLLYNSRTWMCMRVACIYKKVIHNKYTLRTSPKHGVSLKGFIFL